MLLLECDCGVIEGDEGEVGAILRLRRVLTGPRGLFGCERRFGFSGVLALIVTVFGIFTKLSCAFVELTEGMTGEDEEGRALGEEMAEE